MSPEPASVPPIISIPYRPAIDGLRAVAVLAVLIFHLKRQWLPGGFVGVDVFFVISGFLITSILLNAYAHDRFSLWPFYQRRIARLFPAFFTVALVTLIGAVLTYTAYDIAQCGSALAYTSLSAANVQLFSNRKPYFTLSPDTLPFLHYWSLSVEEQFYMLFPAILLFLYRKARRHTTLVLGALCGASLFACIALTSHQPILAFYLLPTRAWELLAGSLLAHYSAGRPAADTVNIKSLVWPLLSWAGVVLILLSLLLVDEGPTFPGYRAILPVLGAICVLGSNPGERCWSERLLSTGPIVFVGRMSYSLYLWHWPVFSFVDYKFLLATSLARVGLKVVLTATCAALCFFLIENPSRVFLNQPRRSRVAFAFVACASVVCVALGIAVRRANYIDAARYDIAQGGVTFNPARTNGSMLLMGDSTGSMYGMMAKDIARTLHLKLNVLSVSGGDPLPHSSDRNPTLWLDSLAFVRREHPDVIVLVCYWESKLRGDKDRLGIAVTELRRYTRRLILLTQPPNMPTSGYREAMRNGSRPPFIEDPSERAMRIEYNTPLRRFQSSNVIVIDTEPLFIKRDGSIRFTGNDGTLLYLDKIHLTDAGANLVRADVIRAIREIEPGS